MPRLALFAAGLGAVVLCEIGFWSAATGDPLYRMHAATARLDYVLELEERVSHPEPGQVPIIPGPKPSERYRAENNFADAAMMFLLNEEFALYYIVGIPVLGLLWLRGDAPTRDLRICIGCLVMLLLFFPVHFPRYTAPRDPRYYVCLTAPLVLCLAHWLGSLRQIRLQQCLGTLLIAAGVGAVAATAPSRDLEAKRRLAEFQRSRPQATIWCSPNQATALAVYSGFRGQDNVAVHFLEMSRNSNAFQNYLLFREPRDTAAEAVEIRNGYVALSGKFRGSIPSNWRKEVELRGQRSSFSAMVLKTLEAAGCPAKWVNRLLAGGGEAVDVYSVE
jgi:hypothetical protein